MDLIGFKFWDGLKEVRILILTVKFDCLWKICDRTLVISHILKDKSTLKVDRLIIW